MLKGGETREGNHYREQKGSMGYKNYIRPRMGKERKKF